MKLLELLNTIDYTLDKGDFINIQNLEIEDVTYNSIHARANTIFVAITGETVDGHKYISDAYSRGCRVFLVEKPSTNLPDDCFQLLVNNTRTALSRISSNFFNNPSKDLTIIGVTGTKGKTTITNYIGNVLTSAGVKVGIIGTNGAFFNGKYEETSNTTPESFELHRILKNMLDSGVDVVTMEVSSSGIMMHRVDDINFDIGVFSNLSEDHVGPKEHPTFEHYLECKSKLFTMCDYGIFNADDPYCNEMINNATCKIETFSINTPSSIQAIDIVLSNSVKQLGTNFKLKTAKGTSEFYVNSPGTFSIYNALAVISVCRRLGISLETTKDALKEAKVEGRVQVLPILPNATLIIDYAHNAVSLENILTTLKSYNPNRILCLFGSVGGRTKGRRKELGDIASKYCDLCVLTSDNPDFEDPINIIQDIEKSFTNSKCNYIIEPDREKAIKTIINQSQDRDIILLAGKGHEKYQLIKGEKVSFNESEIATRYASEMLLAKELQDLSL